MSPGEVGEMLGMTANGVSDLERRFDRGETELSPLAEQRLRKLASLPALDLTEQPDLRSFLQRYLIREGLTTTHLADELAVSVRTVGQILFDHTRFTVVRLRVALRSMRLSDDEKEHLKRLFFVSHGVE